MGSDLLLKRTFLGFLALGLALSLVWTAVMAAAGYASQQPHTAKGDSLVVLAYHEIAEPKAAVIPDYAVTPENFRAQMAWLVANGYHFVSVEQVLAAREKHRSLPLKPVLLSFDDGYRSVYEQAYPVLQRYSAPAVLGLVGHWLEPQSGLVAFGDSQLDRDRFLTWSQLRTMLASGLVSVGSHTYDLHHGIPANPQGNSEPAVTSRLYQPGQGYEDAAAYRKRLVDDLKHNSDLLQRQLGQRPRTVIWPYGRYNATAESVATALGMPLGLTLDDGANGPGVSEGALRRVLMSQEMGGAQGLARELSWRRVDADDTTRAAKVMHVDLDNIDDPNPAQIERNLALLLDRIRAMGVNTVYLQAYADADGNGAADALYFPNRHLPVRADLFNHVAWEIRTRTPVRRLYAWMPVLAFELPADDPAGRFKVVTQPGRNGVLTMGYPRLSPFSSQAMTAVGEIYADLAAYATFDGLLFHDDVTLTDYEDASAPALNQYRAWGLPTDLAAIRASDDLLGRWTNLKTDWLEQITLRLARQVRQNQPQLRTARNLYAQVVLNPHAESWYSQSLDDALRDYDFTAVMAMPWMEKAQDPKAFMAKLVEVVKQKPDGLRKVLFELQSTDWNTHRDVPSTLLAEQIEELYQQGVRHVGYYPDNMHRGTPDPAVLRPVLARHSSLPVTP